MNSFSPRLISLLIATLLTPCALAHEQVAGTSAEALGLSSYRHFVVYPHLEKAIRAQQSGDEQTALREFRYLHQQLPDNVPLTLWLTESLRHFGHDEQARQLLTEQLKRQPQDARLQQQLAAIPRNVKPVTTVEQLLAEQKACDATPTTRCRSETGQNALLLNQLAVAQAQLSDAAFARTKEGKALNDGLIQRAIYLKAWTLADEGFSRKSQQQKLTVAEQNQWFDVLLAGKLDDRIQTLETTPAQQLAYASTLASRGENALLQRYLATHQPRFTDQAQEQNWLYLLSRYGDPAQSRAETLRVAQQMYQRAPQNLVQLDQLSWLLIQNGQSQEASQLLLNRYPFGGSQQMTEKLMLRLAGLLQEHPEWASPSQRARLAKPLSAASLRQLQSQLPGVSTDCATTQRLLGDLSPDYGASAWRQLGACYQQNLAGLALFALQQAEQRQPDVWQHRAVAYQAYAVEDYATAMRAWKAVPLSEMSNEDLMAAANTAQAAGESATRDGWVDEAQRRGLNNSENWWWLHAQRYLPAQPRLALADLDRALAAETTVRSLTSRAALYRELKQNHSAVRDLRQALVMEPDNAATQAALGYALWSIRDYASSRDMLDKALKASPDDPQLIRQLMYVNERLGDIPQTQLYARQVVDELDAVAEVEPLNAAQNQERFNVRRLHEDIGRRWTINFDSTIGLNSGARSASSTSASGAAPDKGHRSYGQLEAEYRLGRNMLVNGDMLSVYSRLFADTGNSGVVMPVKDPMLGAGIRWKPLYDYTFFVAIEEQVPLDRHHGKTDTMLRASASFLNNGRFSDEWHPNGNGWFAQNLYLDAAQYVRQDIQAWTADYRASWHQKVARNQTIEPYAHVQLNGYRDRETQANQLGGIGVRWNIWTGETRYNAWPHKISLGLEYQHTFDAINQNVGERNNTFFTVGVHW